MSESLELTINYYIIQQSQIEVAGVFRTSAVRPERLLKSLQESFTVQIRLSGFFPTDTAGVLQNSKSINFVFMDGHHDSHTTLSYFGQIQPFLTEKAIVVFDDVAWSSDMAEAWHTIARDDRVELALNLGVMGLCVCSKQEPSRATPRYYTMASKRI